MNNMIVFHHNDLDGRAAGFIAALFLDMFEKYADEYLYREIDCCNGSSKLELKPDCRLKQINYNIYDQIVSNVEPGEIVFFVDLTFTDATAYILDELKTLNCNIIWIDHHKSSIDLEESHPEYKDIKGIRSIDRSGAWLTWEWFANPINQAEADIDYYSKINMFYTTITQGCPIHPEKTSLIPKTITEKSPIPLFVRLTDDYDRWIHAFKESKSFNLAHMMYGSSPLCGFWYHLFLEYLSTEMNLTSIRCDECQTSDNDEFVNNVERYLDTLKLKSDSPLGLALSKGDIMLSYDLKTKRTQWYSGGFEGYLTDGTNTYRAAILNIRSNSDCFPDEIIDEYDLVSIYAFNGGETSVGKFKYSFYTNKDNVDCNAIAQYYSPSGGGHASAAGCYSDEFIYEDYGPINKD